MALYNYYLILSMLVKIVACIPHGYYDSNISTGHNDHLAYNTPSPQYIPPATNGQLELNTTTDMLITSNTTNNTYIVNYQSSPQLPQMQDIEGARTRAMINFMEKLIIALGPAFEKELPKAPTNGTVIPTIPTPFNSKNDEDTCPDQFARCSSQAYYPSCNLPNKTDPEVWSQRFNLYFNLSDNISKDPNNILNATLRLYKNYSLPFSSPIAVTIKLFSYTKSLTKRRDKTVLITTTEVASNYTGWVWLDVGDLLEDLKPHHNHGFLITVHDSNNITWHGPSVFVTMDCGSVLRALPFELSSNTSNDRFPTLSIVTGYLKPPVEHAYEEVDEEVPSDNIPMKYKSLVLPNNHKKRPILNSHGKWHRKSPHDSNNNTIIGNNNNSNNNKVMLSDKKLNKVNVFTQLGDTIVRQQTEKKYQQKSNSLKLVQNINNKHLVKSQHNNRPRILSDERFTDSNNPKTAKILDRSEIIQNSKSSHRVHSNDKNIPKKEKHSRSSHGQSNNDNNKPHHGHHHHRQMNKSKSRSRNNNKKSNRRKTQRKYPELHNQ